MAALAKTDVHHGAPHCLLGLFDTVAGSLADWSEFDAEAERWGIEVLHHRADSSPIHPKFID